MFQFALKNHKNFSFSFCQFAAIEIVQLDKLPSKEQINRNSKHYHLLPIAKQTYAEATMDFTAAPHRDRIFSKQQHHSIFNKKYRKLDFSSISTRKLTEKLPKTIKENHSFQVLATNISSSDGKNNEIKLRNDFSGGKIDFVKKDIETVPIKTDSLITVSATVHSEPDDRLTR